MSEYTTIELVDEIRKRLDNENYDEIERLKKEIKKGERKNYELKRRHKAFKERVIRTRARLDKNKNELQSRIDKAIEYIESECHEFYVNEPHYRGYQIINIEPLLDILKGSDKE